MRNILVTGANGQLGTEMRIHSSNQDSKSYTQVDILLPRERNDAQ